MHKIACSEVWGGNREANTDVSAGSLTASLYSSSAAGGKGGDIYYFSLCGAGQLTRFAIADVVGHGKVVSDTSQWLYDALAKRMNGMEGGLLEGLNQLALEHGYKAITTAEVVTYHAQLSNLKYSSAGHPPLFLKREDNGGWQKITIEDSAKRTNLPLGVMQPVVYDEVDIPVSPGDIIFAYTDGVIETPNPLGELFGLDRLMEILEKQKSNDPNQIKQNVLDALKNFSTGSLSHDDVTFMAIKVG
jgi:sigma-B regulation protein RsbU (phosphoserine phosphatase)